LASVAELAADIGERGLLNPLLVAVNSEPGWYDLIAGERRWLAMKLLEWDSAPCQVKHGDEKALCEIAIVDNLHREDLTPLEEANALQSLMELHGYSQRQLARQLNKSQGWVQQRLALLNVAPRIQEMVNTRVFTFAHARALSGLPVPVQETAATHLEAIQQKGIPLTSRQVENVGRQIKKFLDPERFAGVEEKTIAADERNGQIVIRHLLETQPKEILSQAVKRLLDTERNSSARKLLGKKSFVGMSDIKTIIGLLRDPAGWGYYVVYSNWWTDEVAQATRRICKNCIFFGVDAPQETFDGWQSPCERWIGQSSPTTCRDCILPTDAVAIGLRPYYRFDLTDSKVQEGDFSYVESVSDYVQLVEAATRRIEHGKAKSITRERDKHRERLAAFRQVCEQADDGATCPLVTDHFQAQWCTFCELNHDGECEIANHPIDKYKSRPEFWALIQIEDGTDVDGQKVQTAVCIVPRCEMFRFAYAPDLVATGWITFAEDKQERKNTVIRWLRTMISGFTAYGNSLSGMWSMLRWLPYTRPRDKHYDLDKLLRYVLNTWDEWSDARIATLLSAAASERKATKSREIFTLYNPATGDDERWIRVSWDKYVKGKKPWYGWPKAIEWPFEEKECQ